MDGMRALVAFEYVLRIATKFDRLAGCSGLLCFAVPGAASSGGGSGVSCCWPAARACFALLCRGLRGVAEAAARAAAGRLPGFALLCCAGGCEQWRRQRRELLLAGRSGLLCFVVPGAASSGGGSGVSCC